MASNSSESVLAEVVAASIGGSFSASVLYPLEVLKTKLQAESKLKQPQSEQPPQAQRQPATEDPEPPSSSTNPIVPSENDDAFAEPQPPLTAVAYARDLYLREGISPFYAGITTSAFQSATEKALYFFAYTGLKNTYSATLAAPGQPIGAAVNLLIGSIAEWAHLPITLPIDCWTTKIQTSGGKEAPFAILLTMLGDKDGVRGMYRGVQAYTILCLKPAIQYTVFEQVKLVVLANRRAASGGGRRKGGKEALSAAEAFFLGMVARTVATVVVFPYLRAKVMLQSSKAEDGGGIPAMVARMYNDGGMAEIFQGIGPELTRGVLSAALMMMVKEKISIVVNEALRAG